MRCRHFSDVTPEEIVVAGKLRLTPEEVEMPGTIDPNRYLTVSRTRPISYIQAELAFQC